MILLTPPPLKTNIRCNCCYNELCGYMYIYKVIYGINRGQGVKSNIVQVPNCCVAGMKAAMIWLAGLANQDWRDCEKGGSRGFEVMCDIEGRQQWAQRGEKGNLLLDPFRQ